MRRIERGCDDAFVVQRGVLRQSEHLRHVQPGIGGCGGCGGFRLLRRRLLLFDAGKLDNFIHIKLLLWWFSRRIRGNLRQSGACVCKKGLGLFIHSHVQPHVVRVLFHLSVSSGIEVAYEGNGLLIFVGILRLDDVE